MRTTRTTRPTGTMGADPTRVVCDADVLAADLLVGGAARETVEVLLRHDWLTLVASETLLDDAEAVIQKLADEDLATDWRAAIEPECDLVEHPAEDHPGLAAAYRGDAAHLVSLDADLASVRTGLSIQPHADLSVRTPDAFARVFDAEALYEATQDGQYDGPDHPPRG